jgi:hypothetical protein
MFAKILFLYLASFTITQSTFVKNGAYQNIFIEIKEDVSVVECSKFLWSLEVRYF